jgi:hypothetical protein
MLSLPIEILSYENHELDPRIMIFNDCIIDRSCFEIRDYQGIIRQNIEHNKFINVNMHHVKNNMILLYNEEYITMYEIS